MNREHLRPVERVVLRLGDAGFTEPEIAWRLRRTPGHIQRLLALTAVPRASAPSAPAGPGTLRPIERCVLRARREGAEPVEIAARLRRTPAFVSRVATYANYKLERDGGGQP